MITVFGDSHAWAMSFGQLKQPGLDIRFNETHGVNWHNFKVTEIESGFHITSDRVLESKPLDIKLVHGDAYFFCSVLHSAPFFRHPAWKQFCPWECAKDNPDLEPVSTAVIHQWVKRATRNRVDFLELMQDCGIHIHVVEPPKPLERVPGLCGIGPDIVRQVDRIMRDYVFGRLREIGVPVIKAPAETIHNGFTPESFSAANPDDPHHGNAAFNALQLKQVIKAAQK